MDAPTQQQSWTAWVLDSYAASAVSNHDDLFDSDSINMSPTSDSDQHEPSPYGPYVRTGRGGAGNYQWQSQPASDEENQDTLSLRERRKIASTMETIDTAAAIRAAQARSNSHARIGRGGAGNVTYFQSNEPQSSPTSANFNKSPAQASNITVFTGRGGAGNIAASKAIAEQKRKARDEQAEIEAQRRHHEALQHVQSILQPPSQAYLGSQKGERSKWS